MAGKYQIYTQVNFRLTGMEESLQRAKSSLDMVTKQIEEQKARIKQLTEEAKAAGKSTLDENVKIRETAKLKDLQETQKQLNKVLADGAHAVNEFRDGISNLENATPKVAAQMDRLLRKAILSVNSTSTEAAQKIKMLAEALKVSEARVKQFGAGFMNMVKPFNRAMGESIGESRDYIRIFEKYGHTIAKTQKEYKVMSDHAAYSRQNIAQLEGTIKVGYDTNKNYVAGLKAMIAEQQKLQGTTANRRKGISEEDAASTRIMARRKEFELQKQLGEQYTGILSDKKSYSTAQVQEAVKGAEEYSQYMTKFYANLKTKNEEYTEYVKNNGNLITKQAADEAKKTISQLKNRESLSEQEQKQLERARQTVQKFKQDTKAGFWAEYHQELIKFSQEEENNAKIRAKGQEQLNRLIAEGKQLLMDSVDASGKLTEAGAGKMLGEWKPTKTGGRYGNIQNLDDAALKEVKGLYAGINQELSKKQVLTTEERAKLEESKRVLKAIREQENYRMQSAQYTVGQMKEQLKVEMELQKTGNAKLRSESKARINAIAAGNAKVLNNMGMYSGEEQQQAMQLAKELTASGQLTLANQNKLNEAYYKGNEYLKQQAMNSEKMNSAMALGVKVQDLGGAGAQYKNLKSLSDEALKSQIALWAKVKDEARGSAEETRKAEEVLRVLNAESRSRVEIQGKDAMRKMDNLGGMSRNEIGTAMEQMKKYGETVSMTALEREKLNLAMKKGEEYLAREAQEDKVTKMYQTLLESIFSTTQMSESALTEQKRFWEGVRDGANSSSGQVMKAVDALSMIDEKLKGITTKRGQEAMGKMGNLTGMSTGEIKTAIEEMKKYGDSIVLTTGEREKLTKAIMQGEEYLAKQAAAEQAVRMTTQLGEGYANVGNLSNKALTEQVKFWQGVKDNASSSRAEVTKAELALEKLGSMALDTKAGKTLMNTSVFNKGDIQSSIEAMKTLQGTVKDTGSWKMMEEAIQMGTERLRELEGMSKAMSLGKQFNSVMGNQNASTEGIERLIKDYQELVGAEEKAGRSTTEFSSKVAQLNQILETRKANEAKALVANPLSGTSEEVKKAIVLYEDLARKEMAAGNQDAWQRMRGEIDTANQKLAEYERTSKRVTMEGQMAQANNGMVTMLKLTDQALQEQKRFWTEEMNLTLKGSGEYLAAKSKLESLNAELERRAQIQRELKAENVRSKAEDIIQDVRYDTYDKSINGLKENIKLLQEYRGQLRADDTEGLRKVDEAILKMNGDLEKSKSGLQEAMQYLKDFGNGKSFTGSINDIERLKKSLEEYKKSLRMDDSNYAAKMREVQSAMSSLDAKEKEMKGDLVDWKAIYKNIDGATFNQLKKAAAQLDAELKNMSTSQKGYNEKAMALRDIDKRIKTLNNSYRSHQGVLEGAVQRLKSYVMIYMGFQALMMRMRSVISSTKELSDEMTNVQKVTGMTNKDINDMTNSLQALDTRMTTSQLMQMAEQAGKLGLAVRGGTDAIVQFVTVGQQISSTLGEEIGGAEAIADLLKINDLVNKGTVDTLEMQMKRVGSSILDVGNKSKASYGDIVNFTRRVGAVGSVAGLTMPQIVALGGTYSALGASMEQSATAVNRMMIGLTTKTDEMAEAARVSVQELRDLVNSGDTFGALQLVISNIAGEGLPGVQRVLRAIGGRVNAQLTSALSLLVDNMSTLDTELSYASEGYDKATTLGNEFDKMNDNLAGTLARVGNEIKESFVNSGAVETMNEWAHGLFKIVKTIKESSLGFGAFIGTLVLLTRNLWLNKTALFEHQKMLLLHMMAVKKSNGVGAAFGLMWDKIAIGFVSGIKKMGMAIKTFFMSNWLTIIAAAVTALGVAIYKWATAIDPLDKKMAEMTDKELEATAGLNTLFSSLKENNKKVEEAKNAQKEAADSFGKMAEEAGKSAKQLKNHTEKTDEQIEAEERLNEASSELNKAQKERKNVINEINNKYSSYLGFMLSEYSSANMIAAAHERIVSALKDEIYQKALMAAQEEATDAYKEEYRDANINLRKAIGSNPAFKARTDEIVSTLFQYANDVMNDPRMETATKEQYINEVKRRVGDIKTIIDVGPHKREIKHLLLEKGISEAISDYIEVFYKTYERSKEIQENYDVFSRYSNNNKAETDKRWNQNIWKEIQGLISKGDARSKQENAYLEDIMAQYLKNNKDTQDEAIEKNIASVKKWIQKIKEIRRLGLERTVWGDLGAKAMDNMTGAQLTDLYNRLEKAANSTAEDAVYEEIFPEFAQMMNGKSQEEAIATLRDYAEKVKKVMESRGMTVKGAFKYDNSDPAAEEEKRMTDLMNQVKNEFEAEWKRREQELAQEYIDGKITKDVYDMQLEQLKNARLKDLEELDKALLKASNTFAAGEYKMISQTDINTLANYIMKDGRGSKLRDNLHKEIETAEAEFLQANVELKAEIDKILGENNPFDGMVDAFTSTMMKLKILMSDSEVAVARSVGNMAQIEADRTAFLMKQMMKAYELDVEKLRELAKWSGDVEIDRWMMGLTDGQVQVAISKVQEFYDQYIQAVQKEAQRMSKVFDMKWNMKGENGASRQDTWNSLEAAMKRTMAQQNFMETVLSSYRQAGGVNESDRLEIAMTEQQIALLNEKLALMEQEKQARIDAAEREYELAMKQAEIETDEGKRKETLGNAEAKRTAELERIEAIYTESSKDLVQERIAANQTLYEKQMELQQKTIAKIQPYMDALNTFGSAFGEAVFGSKEDRQSAAKQLLIDVMTATKNIIQQYLIDLAMKKLIESEKRKEAIRTLMTEGQAVGGELVVTGAKTTADVAAGIASGTSKEVGSKGFAGLALAAAISVALSALLGMAMSAINKSKTDVSAASGNQVSKLKTGMLTYASGRYPVMGDDGEEYDAKYEERLRTGVYRGGAHFGIFSEKKPEAVIDGDTTEKIMLDYPGIWKDILSLSKNGGLSPNSAYGNRRMATYAEGNVREIGGGEGDPISARGNDEGMRETLMMLASTVGRLQEQLDRGIGVNIPMFGEGGLNKAVGKMERFKKMNGLK